MTDAERSLLFAFIDSTISQLQALRGAVSLLCKEPGKMAVVGERERPRQPEDAFGERYAKMMEAVKVGDDQGEAGE